MDHPVLGFLPFQLLVLFIPVLLFCELSFAQASNVFHTGAALVDITPPEDAGFQMRGFSARTEGFTGILDPIHVRTIVMDDGSRQAAIVAVDLSATTHQMWDRMSKRIEAETGIKPEHLLIGATHTHSAPLIFNDDGWGTSTPQRTERAEQLSDKLEEYNNEVADKIVESVKQAQAALTPARIGVGRGYADVNINRVARTASGGYWIGQNPDGISDKTLHVVRFEDLKGEPLAILVNYSVHAVVAGSQSLLVTGDLPGATSLVVEEHYGNDVVVPWTSAAAGEQNPIYAVLDDPHGGRIDPLNVMGQILGEETIRVADNIGRMTNRVAIQGGQKVVSVSGKEQNAYSPTAEYTFVEADPLDIRLSVLRVGPVVFGCVSGEVLTRIGKRFKNESPFSNSMMITHCNGASGYIPDDKAYEKPSYEITVSRAKEGAEQAVVNGLIELIEKL